MAVELLVLADTKLLFTFGDDIHIANCEHIDQPAKMWVLLKVAYQ